MANAFPPHDGCPVPTIPAITGTLVASCDVTPAPPPCPASAVVVFPPPSFDFGCYKPLVNFNVNYGTGAYADFYVDYPRIRDTGYCQPQFNFDISFPGCETPVIHAKIVSLVQPIFTATVTQSTNSEGGCAPVFNFAIGFPCTYPRIGKGIFQWKPPEDDPSIILLKLTILASSSSCAWSLQPRIYPVCPDILPDPGASQGPGQPPAINLVCQPGLTDVQVTDAYIEFNQITDDGSGHCEYYYAFDVQFPTPIVKDGDPTAYDPVCCNYYDVIIQDQAGGPGGQIVPNLVLDNDNWTLHLEYAYVSMRIPEFKIFGNDMGNLKLCSGSVDIVNSLSTDFECYDDACGASLCNGTPPTCDNRLTFDKYTLEAGGCTVSVPYIAAVSFVAGSGDGSGGETGEGLWVWPATLEFKNGILTAKSCGSPYFDDGSAGNSDGSGDYNPCGDDCADTCS